MHQNSAGASENMQADYKARNALSIHAWAPLTPNLAKIRLRRAFFFSGKKVLHLFRNFTPRADFLERFDIIALLAMGAPQTPPLKTHLMSFTSKGAIFREVKISKIRARHCLRLLAFVNSICGHYRLRWSVRPGSVP